MLSMSPLMREKAGHWPMKCATVSSVRVVGGVGTVDSMEVFIKTYSRVMIQIAVWACGISSSYSSWLKEVFYCLRNPE